MVLAISLCKSCLKSVNIRFTTKLNVRRQKYSSLRRPETVFIENTLEEPVIVVREQDNIDIIGPPDQVSNLRPIIRRCSARETILEKTLRSMQDATHAWNERFWTEHNQKFFKQRQEFINSHQVKGQEERLLTADEMSVFYKSFLDENWHAHIKYNKEWYRKNLTILSLAFRVSLERNIGMLVAKLL